MIKTLIVWQLLLGSICIIVLVAHTLYVGPAHQQRQLDRQALAVQRAVSALPWAQLSSTTPDTTTTAPAQAILQAILAGQPKLLEVSLQAGGYHWRAAAAPERSVAGKPFTSGRALRSEHHFELPSSANNEPLKATVVMLAMPNTGLHSGLLATGFALALATSIIGLLGLNQQLQTESSALLRRLPGQADATSPPSAQASRQPPAPPEPADVEPAARLLLQPLGVAVERAAAAMRALDDRPVARVQGAAVSQRELELAQQSAVRAGRIKSNIIAKTSHELLTPLNSITGFSAILARETAAGSQNQEFAQLIHDNAQQLNTLVNDLIVFSDRETNAIKLHYQPTNLYTLLASIAKSVAPAIAAQGLELRTDFDAMKMFTLDTDPVRVRQIISNLLTNALRNTEHGYIALAAHFDNTPDNSRWVKIAVSDSGCGIDTTKQQAIFSEFVSGNSRFNKTVSHQPASEKTPSASAAKDAEFAAAASGAYDTGLGFGLGLAIVDDLCQRMGADIALQSALNQGTTFTISLPARNIVKQHDNTAADHRSRVQILAGQDTPERHIVSPHSKPSAAHTSGLPTLVVDDNQSNLILLRHLLNTSGCDCDTAGSSEQAMAMLQQHTYAWLFIDIRMQPIDGFELRRNIRALPAYKHAPIIACTAHTSDDEYRHLIDSGFDAVLPKPISERRLAELQDQFQGALSRLSPGHASVPTPAPANKTYGKNLSSVLPIQTEHAIQTERAIQTEHAIQTEQAKKTTQPENVTASQPVYQVRAAIEHSGGSADVAKSICLLIIEELASALQLQRRGFTCHSDRLEHFHRLNGSASMGGTPELKRLLHSFESRLKACPDLADSTLAKQQQTIEEHQAQLLQWLQQQNIDRLFATA